LKEYGRACNGDAYRVDRVGSDVLYIMVMEWCMSERKIRYISERVALGAVACFWLLGVSGICYLFYGVW
jgi:hypothetical protein